MGFWKQEPGGLFVNLPPMSMLASAPVYTPVMRRASLSGVDASLDMWCIRDYYTSTDGGWIVAASPMPGLVMGGKTLRPQMSTCNGAAWFSTGSSYYAGVLFYSLIRDRWIFRDDDPYPNEPAAAVGLDGSTLVGDAWYESANGSFAFASMPSFAPAGTLLNGNPVPAALTPSIAWDRWERDPEVPGVAPCGVYRAVQGLELSPETYTIGVPVWLDQNGARYVRSLRKAYGRYAYGGLAWHNGRSAYVLGDPASAWWETTSAPTVVGGATLESRRIDESGAVVAGIEDALVLTFFQYEMGDNVEQHYMAEVVSWRL